MSERRVPIWLLLLLLLLLIAVGWLIGGLWTYVPEQPAPVLNKQGEKLIVTPELRESALTADGWCCPPGGGSCNAAPDGIRACFSEGGILFHRDRLRCDQVCIRQRK